MLMTDLCLWLIMFECVHCVDWVNSVNWVASSAAHAAWRHETDRSKRGGVKTIGEGGLA